MTNIVKTNNPSLKLSALSVGLYSTLRIELPLVPSTATDVQVIVTNGTAHTGYDCTYDSSALLWAVDVAAGQFSSTGKQKYEVAYKLAGEQFWDGAGWITIEDATTSGIEPDPKPVPTRYAVCSVNGYAPSDSSGAITIPKLTIGTATPTTTEGFVEGDQFFDRLTGRMWVLCTVDSVLSWVKCAGGSEIEIEKLSNNASLNQVRAKVNELIDILTGEDD